MTRASSKRSLGVLAVAVGSLLCESRHAHAQSLGETIDLHYDAPPGCPSRDALLRAIQMRAPRGWSPADDRSFRVQIEHGSSDYRGQLQVERKGRVLSVREIHGATCEVVGTALAVFVAIALDPAELSASESPEAAIPGPNPSTPPAPSPPAPSGTAPPPPPPTPPTPPPPPPVDRATRVQRPSPRWYWGAGVNANAVLTPSVAWGGRVHVELTRFAPNARLAPELRLSWAWADFSESPEGGGRADFRFETVRAEACALLADRGRSGDPTRSGGLEPVQAQAHDVLPTSRSAAARSAFTIAGCAGFETGHLRATTSDLPRTGSTTKDWNAPTAALRPGWFLSEWLSFEAELGLVFPLPRASFVVSDPERTVYRIPAVALTAGLGFRIWAGIP